MSEEPRQGREHATATAVRPEIELLLALADPAMDATSAEATRTLLTRDVAERETTADWAWLLDQLARHRVLPLAGYNIKTFWLHLAGDGHSALIPHHWVPTLAFEGNSRRNEVLAAEYGRIVQAATDAEILFAVRKGLPLGERYHPHRGARRTNDLDLLVTPEGAERLAGLLTGLGYQQGLVVPDGTVRPHSRATRVYWSLNFTNRLPFVKPVSAPGVECLVVDLCLSVIPSKERGTDPTPLLERRVPLSVAGVETPVLAPADQLLDVCLHLHKEATARYYIADARDIALSKYIDVAQVLRGTDQRVRDDLVAVARELGVTDAVYFALAHTARFYPDAVPDDLAAALRPADTAYLEAYGQWDGDVRYWQRPFLERAFATPRTHGVDITPWVPTSGTGTARASTQRPLRQG